MSNPPTARRRPTSAGANGSPGTGAQRPVRKTGAAPAVRPEPAAASGPKLVVTGGPKSGEEFTLEEGEYVVGRSTDNPICIADTSVSRKHIMLRQVGSGWTVSDLGSGNGTLVNGEPISDETVLSNGDVIIMGDTEVTFTDVANATMMVDITSGKSRARPSVGAAPGRPPPRPERVRPSRGTPVRQVDPDSARKKKLAVIGVVGVLVLSGAGLVVLKMKQDAAIRVVDAKRELQLALEREHAAILQEAKKLVRENKWVEAKEILLDLQQKAPGMDQVKDYLERAEKEIPNMEHLAAAEAAIQERKLAVTKASLEKVSSDTQAYERVNKIRKEMSDTADLQAREARKLLDGKQLDPAKAITDDVLATFPEHRDAKIINDEAVRLIKVRNTPLPPTPPPPPKDPWETAVARFVDGDISGAVALANACMTKSNKCKGGLKDMTEFGNLYKKLEDLDAKGLARLLSLDKDITGNRGPSKMAKNAGTRAANIFYKSASGARAAGQWARAVDFARRTLQADADHVGAKNIITELRAKAKELYLQAYALKDSNPEDAIPKFKEVMAMTPSDDETHQKAKNRLADLQR